MFLQEGAFVKEGTKACGGKNPVYMKVGGVIYTFYKLVPLDEKMRKLNNVRHLWEAIFYARRVQDVNANGFRFEFI